MMKKYQSEFLKNDNDDDVMQCSGIQHYKLKFLCIGDDKHAAIQGKAVLFWRYVNQPKKHGFHMNVLVIVLKVNSRNSMVCVIHAGLKAKKLENIISLDL